LQVTLPSSEPPNWYAAAQQLRAFGAENSAERVEARARQ
jgi:hypothetical protein